jgi:hypothetical protein
MTPDDSRSPLVVLQEKALAQLDQVTREQVVERRRERDDNDQPTWMEELENDLPLEDEPEDSGWTLLMLRPIDPLDTREPICTGRWPTKFINELYADERARAQEQHRGDD